MEENNKDNDCVLAETEQNFAIVTNNATDFVIDEDSSKNIASSLAEKAVAELVGTFTATTAGRKTLTAAFNYGEGSVEPVKTETEVIAVKLTIELIQPAALPANFPKNFTQEVEFLVKNETEFEATQIKLDEMEGLVGIKIIEEKPNNGTYEEENETNFDEFIKDSAVKLDSKHQFRIKGQLKTDEVGSKLLKILVKYAELAYLPDEDADKKGAKFEQMIDIQAIEIVGAVTTKLPAKIKLGSTYPVIFQFTNNNTEFSAKGVNITITETNETPNFSEQEFYEAN